MRRGLGVLWAALAFASACDDPEEAAPVCTPEGGLEMYEKRIAPLLEQNRPSSCNQCHLSGIDLQRYATGDPCRTMACLVDEGLVSLDDPESSTILGWIERAQPDSALITARVIDEEYDGFKAWIEWSAACGADVCGEIEDPCAPEVLDPEAEPARCEELSRDESAPSYGDAGDCSDLTLETLFRDRVYVHRARCAPCHTQGVDIEGPDWVREGECNEGSLETMRWLQREGLVDPVNPAASPLLLKPLHEDAGGIEHGAGHAKFANTDDPAYRDMLYWIGRWGACESAGL